MTALQSITNLGTWLKGTSKYIPLTLLEKFWLKPFAAFSISVILAGCGVGAAGGAGGDATSFTIGGTITGLFGNITLANNGGDNLFRAVSGPFTFATAVPNGGEYTVSIVTQPVGQSCGVSSSTGTVNSKDVTTVSVDCSNTTHAVGGTITGLTGHIVLQNNAADDLRKTADGSFTFPTVLVNTSPYVVTVLTQPLGQTCTVANGTGAIGSNDITNVLVSCADNDSSSITFPVGGTVTGLVGTVVLQVNEGADLSLSTDGDFIFPIPITDTSTYAATVLTQPFGQTCTVTNGSGTVSGAAISDVAVACEDNKFTIGGKISGLAGNLVLQDNNGDDLTLSTNDDFTFATALKDGTTYTVSILTQPTDQACDITQATGTVAAANVTSVVVSCETISAPAAPTLNDLDFGIKQLKFSWDAIDGATLYRLKENPDGISGYTQVGDDLTTTSYDLDIAIYSRFNASYMLEACNAFGCTDSDPVSLAAGLISTIGYLKASNTGANDIFGSSVALSADGNTLAVGATGEASNAIGINPTGINGLQTDNSMSNAGAVYVFSRSDGVWTQQAYVKASNTGAGDSFGQSVALSADGSTLAVGANGEASAATGIDGVQTDDPTKAGAGAAYVFTRSSNGKWTQQAYVKASNTDFGDQFGQSVALSTDGNTLAVGASGEQSKATGINSSLAADNSLSSAGAVYVFARSDTTWSQQAYVKASNTGANDSFGNAVTLSGDGNTLAVGAYREASGIGGINGNQADNTAFKAGAVYVFTRSSALWSQQAYVKASNIRAPDFFGWSVVLSTDGNTLAVGANGEASAATGIDGDQSDITAAAAGAAYVFTRSGVAWSQQAYVKASNTDAGDSFGQSVALSADGDTLAVGANGEASNAIGVEDDQTDNTLSAAGAVYVFTRDIGGVWSRRAYVKAPNTGAGDAFGYSLALTGDGNILAVGANGEASSATGIGTVTVGDPANDFRPKAGAAYLY